MLNIYNSLTKKMEEFSPIDSHNVKIYICGPTVYDHSHIGHARTYVSFDVIRNILEKYYNYNVTLVMNITDIDDKIINKSKETGIPMKEITEEYTRLFLEDMALLNVRKPTVLTKVTEYLDKIKEYVDILVEKKYAYESNGSIYFDVEEYRKKFKYPIFREVTEEYQESTGEKKSQRDFALWKKVDQQNEEGFEKGNDEQKGHEKGNVEEIKDEEKGHEKGNDEKKGFEKGNDEQKGHEKGNDEKKFTEGRPGWHIECSVMANDVLGDHIDIHAGGVDLKFPHHENEVAQCQAFFGKQPWVNYFMHTGHLNINGLKMSKSLKNFTTIKSILERCSPVQLRILFLHHHWNKDMNYEEEQIKFAENVEKKLYNFLMYVESTTNINNNTTTNINTTNINNNNSKYATTNINNNTTNISTTNNSKYTNSDKEVLEYLAETSRIVDKAFGNNFDTPTVIKSLLDLVSFCNSKMPNKYTLSQVRDFLKRIMDILGIDKKEKAREEDSEKLVDLISNFRNEVRATAKKGGEKGALFKICDEIRNNLKNMGYIIEDNNLESMIKRL